MSCPFCDHMPAGEDPVVVLNDAFPSAPGHKLIVPRRHVPYVRDLSSDEMRGLGRVLLALVQNPRGHFTIGINDGPAAGQTIPHVHVHVIPRFHGDVPNPRGGIRNVLPGGDYTQDPR